MIKYCPASVLPSSPVLSSSVLAACFFLNSQLQGLFAAANIFSSLKLVYIFSVNPHLGPLQVSLGRMILDICKFCFLYLLVLFSFSCGQYSVELNIYTEQSNLKFIPTIQTYYSYGPSKYYSDLSKTWTSNI